jgi:hypothetical protein
MAEKKDFVGTAKGFCKKHKKKLIVLLIAFVLFILPCLVYVPLGGAILTPYGMADRVTVMYQNKKGTIEGREEVEAFMEKYYSGKRFRRCFDQLPRSMDGVTVFFYWNGVYLGQFTDSGAIGGATIAMLPISFRYDISPNTWEEQEEIAETYCTETIQ